MRIDYTGEEERQYWSRLHLRYYSRDLFISPHISRVKSPTISEYRKVLKVSRSAPIINMNLARTTNSK